MAAELPITDPTRRSLQQQLPSAIKALRKRKRIDCVGALGELDMDAKGDRTAGLFYQLLAFKPDLVRTGDVAISRQP
jgi:hypothetical protein